MAWIKENREEFADIIRRERVCKVLSLRCLAKECGVSATYLSKLENCKLDSPPSKDLILRLSKRLDIDSEYLLELSDRIDWKAKYKTLERKFRVVPVLKNRLILTETKNG